MKFLFICIISCTVCIQTLGKEVRLNPAGPTRPLHFNKKVIDKAALRCFYEFKRSGTKKEDVSRTDTLVLYVGDSLSKFYDPARLRRDSLLNDKMKNMDPSSIKSINVLKGESARDLSKMPGSTYISSSGKGESYQILKDRRHKKITVVDYTSAIGDRFQYEETIDALPWIISDSTDTVLSYPCRKAALKFRGRDYVAWYSSDIPINEGPWKFMGLPGLIIKIQDSAQHFSFTLIGLEQLNPPVAMELDDTKYMKCTRAEFEKLKKKQDGGLQYNFNAGNITIATMPGHYEYVPMELEP